MRKIIGVDKFNYNYRYEEEKKPLSSHAVLAEVRALKERTSENPKVQNEVVDKVLKILSEHFI